MFKNFRELFPQLPASAYDQCVAYYQLLKKWNNAHNLVQKNTLVETDFEVRHLIDGMQLIHYLDPKKSVYDIGCGAGIPGVFLSIAGFDVHLVEIDKNKAAFLKVCKNELSLGYTVHDCDVADVHISPCAQIVSRAFTQLSGLISIQSSVSRETIGVYLKGKNHDPEILEAKNHANFEVEISKSASSDEGVVLVIRNVIAF